MEWKTFFVILVVFAYASEQGYMCAQESENAKSNKRIKDPETTHKSEKDEKVANSETKNNVI